MDKHSDKRLFPRRPTTPVPVVLCSRSAPAEAFSGEVLDYSPSGLTVEVKRAVAVGTLLTVRPRDDGLSGIEARVANCSVHEDSWRLGCQFDHPHHFDDLRMFGD
jgi:hypothetical protein